MATTQKNYQPGGLHMQRPVVLNATLDGLGWVQARDWDQVSLPELTKNSLSEGDYFSGSKTLRVAERRVVNGKPVDGVRTIHLTSDAASLIGKQLFSIALLKERAAGPVQVKYERADAAGSPFSKRIDQLVETINVERKAALLDAQKNKAKGGRWEQLMNTLGL